MLSKGELRILSEIGNGNNNVSAISRISGLSVPQTYKIVRSLREKNLAHIEHGTVLIDRKTHIAILLSILSDSLDSYKVLSDSGMEIIRTLTEPRTVSEISSITGLHQTTITRKIDHMGRMGMVRKMGSRYSINKELWPKIMDLARSYDAYTRLTDIRVPFGSTVYHSSNDMIVFSSDMALDDTRTAFSRYGDFGMEIHPGTNYYCSPNRELGIKDVFLHSLYVVEKDNNWRNKMLSLIFFVKHKDKLNDISHPLVNDMRTVLEGRNIEGWVPLREMNGRAEMYGVNLYDN